MFNEPSEGLLTAEYTRRRTRSARKRRRARGFGKSSFGSVYLRGDRVHRVDDEHGDGRVEEQVEAYPLPKEAGQVVEDDGVLHHGAEVEPAREARGVAEH